MQRRELRVLQHNPALSPSQLDATSFPSPPGVVHRITPSQWRYVLETEGASGEDNEDHGYRVVQAAATTYDGRQLQVVTLTVPPKIKARLQVSRAAGRGTASGVGRVGVGAPTLGSAARCRQGSPFITGLSCCAAAVGPRRAAQPALPDADSGRRGGAWAGAGVSSLAGRDGTLPGGLQSGCAQTRAESAGLHAADCRCGESAQHMVPHAGFSSS